MQENLRVVKHSLCGLWGLLLLLLVETKQMINDFLYCYCSRPKRNISVQ